jgi:hypothetical protein
MSIQHWLEMTAELSGRLLIIGELILMITEVLFQSPAIPDNISRILFASGDTSSIGLKFLAGLPKASMVPVTRKTFKRVMGYNFHFWKGLL